MPTTISNPRDVLVQLLVEGLYVERRLAGGVVRDLMEAVYGAARAAELSGDRANARQYYKQLLAQTGTASGRTEVKRAKVALARR